MKKYKIVVADLKYNCLLYARNVKSNKRFKMFNNKTIITTIISTTGSVSEEE